MSAIKNLLGIFRKRDRVELPEYPSQIIMEPTNACNLRCRMCSVWGEGVERSRPTGFMAEDVWRAAIDEMGSWPVPVNLDIHGAGEPLLHKNLLEIIEHAKTKKNINLGFFCNGTLLNEERAKRVVELGVDWICFSVDGAQKEIFEHYRKGAVLDEVEANIERLISMKKEGKPLVILNMVGHDEADKEVFFKRWTGKADALQVSIKKPVRREDNRRIHLRKECPLLYSQMVMGWDGHTVLCCEDCWGQYITGRFPENSLYDIWHGKPFEKARELHETGKQRDIELCICCDSGVFHEFEDRISEGTSLRIELEGIKEEHGLREP